MKEKRISLLWHEQKQSSIRLGIYSTSVFHALVRHERNRVDRDGNCFSMAVFDSSAAKSVNFSERNLCELLKKEMRTVDEAGWLDDSTIGVLLPSTDLGGGQRFASRACGISLANGHPLSYDVYSYPNHWIPMDKGETTSNDAVFGKTGIGRKGFSAFNLKIPTWKRILDISVSFVALALLWPLFLLVGIYIKIVSPGPVFFKQTRIGYGGKPFTFIKFRSMKYGNDQGTHQNHIVNRIRSDNPLMKLDSQDKRIIPGGRFIRKACIDELPQILHVFRGEMSLVGPRPCLPYEAKEFLHWHNHRFDVLPGMTGLWQVSGKNKLTFTQMIRLDISYANNMSVWNDLKIIVLTIPAIFTMVTENLASKIKRQTSLAEEPNREEAIS